MHVVTTVAERFATFGGGKPVSGYNPIDDLRARLIAENQWPKE